MASPSAIVSLVALFFTIEPSARASCLDGAYVLAGTSRLTVVCVATDERGRAGQVKVTLDTDSRFFAPDVDLGTLSADGEWRVLTAHPDARSKAIATAAGVFVLERVGPQAAIPLRLNVIECTSGRCAWAPPRCGYDRAFRLPGRALAQSQQLKPDVRAIVDGFLMKLPRAPTTRTDLTPGALCGRHHLGYWDEPAREALVNILTLRALSGDEWAGRCLDAIAAHAELAPAHGLDAYQREKEFVARTCPRAMPPPALDPLPPAEAPPPDLTTLVGVVLDGNVGPRVAPLFQKQGGAWVGAEPALFAAPVRFRVPTPVIDRRVTEPLWKVSQPAAGVPTSLSWSAVFDGKSFGTLGTEGYEGQNALAPRAPRLLGEQIAAIKTKGHFVFAATRGRVTDPEGWTRARPTPADEAAAKAAFIARYGNKKDCVQNGDLATLVDAKRPLAPGDLRVHPIAYRARSGRMLLGVGIPHLCVTDPESPDHYGYTHWYTVARGSAAAPVAPAVEAELLPAEAADFDGDGHAEWVFRAFAHESFFVLLNHELKVIAQSASSEDVEAEDTAYQVRRTEDRPGPFATPTSPPPNAQLELVKFWDVDVDPITGLARPASIHLTKADYFLRVRTGRTSAGPGQLEEGYAMIFEPGAPEPSLVARTSALRGEPAVFFSGDGDQKSAVVVGAAVPGHGGRARVELFRVRSPDLVALDLSAPAEFNVAEVPTRGDLMITVGRVGKLDQREFAFNVATRFGGSARKTRVAFTLDANAAYRRVKVPIPAAPTDGSPVALDVSLDPTDLPAHALDNANVLGLRSSATVRLSFLRDESPPKPFGH